MIKSYLKLLILVNIILVVVVLGINFKLEFKKFNNVGEFKNVSVDLKTDSRLIIENTLNNLSGELKVDLGVLPDVDFVEGRILLLNKTGVEIFVNKIQKSCGCISIDKIGPDRILPKQALNIKFTVKQSAGPFSDKIDLHLNESGVTRLPRTKSSRKIRT